MRGPPIGTLHDPNPDSKGEPPPSSGRPHSRRPRRGPGHALLPGVLPVPQPDGLGSDSGRHALPSASVGGREDRRPPGTGRDAARAPRHRRGRRADHGADELARRLGARLINDVQNNTLRVPPPEKASPSGRWSSRRCTHSGRRRRRICPHWCRACSRKSATWPRRRSVSSPASVADCYSSSPLSPSPASSMAFGEGGERAIR